jgi:hypothetical protein
VEDVSQEEVPQHVTVTLNWDDAVDVPAEHVNQFLGQVGPPAANGIPDGVYVTLGSVVPPVILANDGEARMRAIEALRTGLTKVRVHGRFHMSRDLLDDVIRVLQITAATYDAAVKGALGSTDGGEPQ